MNIILECRKSLSRKEDFVKCSSYDALTDDLKETLSIEVDKIGLELNYEQFEFMVDLCHDLIATGAFLALPDIAEDDE